MLILFLKLHKSILIALFITFKLINYRFLREFIRISRDGAGGQESDEQKIKIIKCSLLLLLIKTVRSIDTKFINRI